VNAGSVSIRPSGRLRAAALAALACLGLAACRSLELPGVGDDPRVRAIAERKAGPLPFHVLLPPARIDTGKTEGAFVRDYPIAETAAEVFRRCGLFASVQLPGEPPSRPGGPPPDLRLELRLHRVEPRFAGRNGAFFPNLLLWSFLIFPSWWVADETYRLSVDLEAVLVSARSGRRLATRVASVMVQGDLDDFQRGWVPFGILLAPEIFGPRNWRCVTEELLPHAIRSAEVELAEWVDRDLRRMDGSGLLAPLAATDFSVCAGISKYDSPALHNLRWPHPEARVLAAYASDPRLGGVPQGHATLLLDDQAPREALEAALEQALLDGPRPGGRDAALIYLAGYGAARDDGKGGRAFLFLPYDADPEGAPDAGFSLKALAGLVSRSGAARILVVLDADFGPSPPGGGAPPEPDSVLLSAFREIAVTGKAVVVHVRNRAPGSREGFARDLASALVGKGDRDGNGVLTALELRSFLAEASKEGGYEALVVGENLESFQVPFAFPRASTGKEKGSSREPK